MISWISQTDDINAEAEITLEGQTADVHWTVPAEITCSQKRGSVFYRRLFVCLSVCLSVTTITK